MTKERLIKSLKIGTTTAKLRVFEAWKLAGKNLSATGRALDVSPSYVKEVVDDWIIRLIYEVECDGVEEDEAVPTPEWLQAQFKRLYDKAVASGDEEAQDKYLKRIMEFKAKFGEMVDKESALIGQMKDDELIVFLEELAEQLKKLKGKWGWREGTDTSTPGVEGSKVEIK